MTSDNIFSLGISMKNGHGHSCDHIPAEVNKMLAFACKILITIYLQNALICFSKKKVTWSQLWPWPFSLCDVRRSLIWCTRAFDLMLRSCRFDAPQLLIWCSAAVDLMLRSDRFYAPLSSSQASNRQLWGIKSPSIEHQIILYGTSIDRDCRLILLV